MLFKILISCLVMFSMSLSANEKFNVLLFTADDLHGASLETYGGKVKDLTPNLDRFAKQGMTFDRSHVNVAICAPVRAVIATGLLSHNSGAMGFMPTNPGVPEVSGIFRKAGFKTGILGKYGHSTPVPGMKWDYNFDQKDLGNGRSPKLYYERSKKFFEMCKSEGKNFYFMVNSHDPHRPYCDPNKLTKDAEMPSKVYSPDEVEVLGFVPDLPGVRKELAMYQNSTRRLDDTFGKVMQALEESGYAKNTLVIFMTDNGIAIPFAKCNTWFHATKTPFLFRLPGVIKENQRDSSHFVSAVDLLPTFLDLTGVKGPEKLDGKSILPILKGGTESGRDYVFTQIDKKAGGAPVPMRAVQNKKYGYIYNPFSDGKLIYKNNNEGLTMKAMNEAATSDPAIAARVKMFRMRVPEEFYDLEKDPNCLNNLINNPEFKPIITQMQAKLEKWMSETNDPMLEAFKNKNDRSKVDSVIEATYGKYAKKAKKKKSKKK